VKFTTNNPFKDFSDVNRYDFKCSSPDELVDFYQELDEEYDLKKLSVKKKRRQLKNS
jgi:hypothetical protein